MRFLTENLVFSFSLFPWEIQVQNHWNQQPWYWYGFTVSLKNMFAAQLILTHLIHACVLMEILLYD